MGSELQVKYMISTQKHLCCKKRRIQELQVTVTITEIERSDIWCGQESL